MVWPNRSYFTVLYGVVCVLWCGVMWCGVAKQKLLYCTVLYGVAKQNGYQALYSCCYTSSGGTEQLQWKRVTDTVVQFLCLFGEGFGCHSLFCCEEFQCLQFCAVLVQVMCSWRTGAPVFCPTALRIIH